jgi:hypothetical protein
MAITLGDETFRPLLRDDIKDAWSLSRVHYDPPQTPGSLAVLPRAFLQLEDVDSGEARGFGRKVLLHTYTITGQFAYPSEGTLEQAKVEKAQALLDVLTVGSSIFHTEHRYRDVAIRFEESRLGDDTSENVYSIHLSITLEWVTEV